ncbi:MAG: hypothetical protein LBS54_04225 [Dysgonamonadaceae bacterium]|jgi:hypothetical protein|nr:hypothetical protein [Dysgonamonadaceae bacterium]
MEKKIKSLEITVTYKVGYCDVEISDEMLKKFIDVYDCGGCNFDSDKHADAVEWLNQNICEADAYEWSYEIINLEYDETEN